MDGFSNRNIQFRSQPVPRSSSLWFWLILIFGVCVFCLPNLLPAEEDGEADVPNVDSFQVESTQPIEKEGVLAEEDGEVDFPPINTVQEKSTQPIEKEGILAEEGGEADAPNVDLFQMEGIQPIGREGILTEEDREADSSYITSVHVEGNQRIETEAILAVITTRKGDRLDYDQLDRDLRDIYRMKYFKDVKIDIKDGLEGKAVSFIVSEKPSIGEVVFDGNSKKKDEDLKEEVGINLYSILDDNEISQSINRLKDYYREKGYFNAEIKADLEPLPNNEVRVKYQVVENDKVYITKIEFLGNNKFDDDDLKDVMKSSEKGFFSWITDSGFLNEKMLEYDVHMITTFYHNNGYINAKVGEPDITFNDKGITITLEIEEGEQYSVSNVSVAGDLIMSEDAFLAQVLIGREGVFNREVLRNDILALKDIYVDAGFAYAEVSPRTKQDNEKHFVDITYVISKGPKVRFERINVIGNTITRDKVIRRELKAIEGGNFSGGALRDGTENLKRLGFFEDVEMLTRKGSTDDTMVLDVKVKEQSTGSFSVGAGYSSENSIFATFQISQSNLFGRGQKLQASASLGGVSSNFNISFTEPWLFDTRLSGTFTLYRSKQEYDNYTIDNTNVDEYSKKSFGGRLGVGFPLDKIDEFTRGSLLYTYDDTDISNVPFDASYAWKDMEGRNKTISITASVFRDTRDEPWNTTKGSYNSLSFEFAGRFLGGDIEFNKLRATSGWFFPFWWDTVFLVRGNFGFIGDKGEAEKPQTPSEYLSYDGISVPVYQRFRIGGLNSVRGFEAGSISPYDEVFKEYTGGLSMMYYNFEFRFPLLKSQGITGLVFFDTGNVWENHAYDFGDLRQSVGGGIRWYSPMGPLRIEYGKNLDPEDWEDSGKWEFSIGGGF